MDSMVPQMEKAFQNCKSNIFSLEEMLKKLFLKYWSVPITLLVLSKYLMKYFCFVAKKKKKKED